MSLSAHIASLALFASPIAAFAQPAAAPAQEDDGFAEVLEEVKDLMLRLPMRYHIRAYERLARTQDPRGIQELAEHYAKPDTPKDQQRYAIAASLAKLSKKRGSTAEIASVLSEWRADDDGDEDTWLWSRALTVEVRANGPDVALEIARNAKSTLQRAAAIEALAANKDESLYELVPELAKAMPKKDPDKVALMGAMATALGELGNKKTRVKPEWKRMALSLIAMFDDEKAPRGAKLILARHLAVELEAEQVVLEGNAWRALLAQRSREEKEKKKPKKEGEIEYVRPSFFGVEVTGDRICYLIDLSDSMAAPIPIDWKPEGAPTSGPTKRKKRKKGEVPTEADIPWWIVETRFDLAREHLRISLERLQPDQKFTVIGFGTRADYLDGCEGMVKASPGNIRKVLKALDGIDVGAPQGERIHGTIWGETNLHAGLKLAYATSKKGEVKGPGYVEASTFVDGADTLFVLSDGDPSVDDYTVKDVDYGDGIVVTDTESKKESETRTAQLDYMGPYANWEGLLADAERMNMLRELEIHVVSLGEGDEQALRMLAEIGLGELQVFGREKK